MTTLVAQRFQLPPPIQHQPGLLAGRVPDLGPLVWLAMVTGARRGELCALRWRNLDLERQVVVIRASIAQNGTDIWEKDTKLHQRRHLTLDPTP